MPKHPILEQLAGGDRRSIAEANLAVAEVLRDPLLFKPLFTGLTYHDPVVRIRCADAVEKITATHPEYLKPHTDELLTTLAGSEQPEVRRRVATLIARLDLTEPQQVPAVAVLLWYTTDKCATVKIKAVQALRDLASRYTALKPVALKLLREMTPTGIPANAQWKKLLTTLESNQ